MNQDNTDLDILLSSAEATLSSLSKKREVEEALSLSLPKTFNLNIAAFKKYIPEVAARFENYNANQVKLVATEDGVANLIDPETGVPLYNDTPLAQCKEQVERNKQSPKFAKIAYTLEESNENTFIHTKYLTQMHDLYLGVQQKLEPLNAIPEHLGAMIVFGVGLGYHLEMLLEDIKIDHLYVCEPNNDWFFASLHTCKWYELLQKLDEQGGSLTLNIGVSWEQFSSDFINNIKNIGSFYAVNAVIYQHYPSAKLSEIINQFAKDFHLVSVGWGFFDDGVISIAHDYANAQLGIPFLKANAQLARKYRDKPVFIVANGPSIDETLKYVKEYQDNAIIFSCGSAIKTLLKHNIIPDFHLEIERTMFTYAYLAEFIDNEAMKKINFLTGNIMHPKCAELFKWTGMGFKPTEPSTIIELDLLGNQDKYAALKFCNPVVGNTALSFACYMGFEEVYLFGMDCGYKDPNRHHSVDSMYYKDDGSERESIGHLVRAGELTTPGNFGGEVFTTSFLHTGKFYSEHLLKLFPKVNAYNCSDGARINGATPLQAQDILIKELNEDKQVFVEYLKNELFIHRDFDDAQYKQVIAIDKFNEIIDKIISFLAVKPNSRAELTIAMREQVRYLFQYSHSKYRHIYFILEGSLTYAHSLFRLMLFDFKDEKETVDLVHQAIDIFTEYMEQAKVKYADVLTEIDQQEGSLMELFRE